MIRFVFVLSTLLFTSSNNVSAFQPATVSREKAATKSTTRLYETRTKSWNPLRFAQQSSKFVKPPFSPPPPKETIRPGQVLWQPTSTTSQKNPFQFAPLDDVVMGGVSDSTIDNASGLWKGTVTDESNGGFVGIRSTPNVDLDLSSCKGLEWRFQTSANMPGRLKIVLRDTPDFNGIAWSTSADIPSKTSKREVRVKVPLNPKSLVPTRFAQILKGSETEKGIDKTSVTALQLVYSKFEYEGALNPKFQSGEFELQLLEVRTY